MAIYLYYLDLTYKKHTNETGRKDVESKKYDDNSYSIMEFYKPISRFQ